MAQRTPAQTQTHVPKTILCNSTILPRKSRLRGLLWHSNIHPIKDGVPQGSAIGPLLYLLYTADIPTPSQTTVATFADDTAILATHKEYRSATSLLQSALGQVSTWSKKWKIKLNEGKSTRVDFSLRPHPHEPVTLDGQVIVPASTARYLGMHLDSKLNWRAHHVKKRDHMKELTHSYDMLLHKTRSRI